eukprot:CAMPEP_0201526924 /NCGR_PEP_ID=MMETSP0161_2-20130828/33421_1 /ASSEMBLY_ACC=CAM_ASM_000251 /TAXON_ID=180227 /ORGANISM="Neoparamoeba aestuarina, Strain SoJaBio B1-5/56/2" /LENGTH=42 /DNA_ID= /DNA_START= /DNA_END= /DNA_ORIENTATION=
MENPYKETEVVGGMEDRAAKEEADGGGGVKMGMGRKPERDRL